ncbi:MAG TPA: FKBP-type peptidyl-prolyl cis-trans isomerase [Candidatus Saccharimonadales bacterium]|nr:FKBP-type peptidyl-prolyl cis-trans isomerase [Candidatus Saccharimonadales bacterium]
MESSTKKWQRVVIWIIAVVLTVGTLGFYFIIILQNNNQASQTAQLQEALASQAEQEQQVDPTALIVDGDVSELKIEDLVVGDGTEVKAGDYVKVNYKGTLASNGVKFDSSYDRGEPIEFSLDGVIEGWQQGMPGMKVGGKRRLIIPSELAYGATAIPGIPANSDLVFEIELLEVKPAQ